MINEQIEKFYKNNTSEIIKIVKQQLMNKKQIEFNDLFEKISTLAREHRYDFSTDELIKYEKSINDTGMNLLSDNLLSDVSGGVSLRSVSAGLMSLLISGAILTQPVAVSNAVLNSRDVLSSYDEFVRIGDKMEETKEIEHCGIKGSDIQNSELQMKEIQNQDIDWEYMQYLDLAIGAVALDSGVVENFRFNNGYIEEMTDGNRGRDKGKGSVNVMTCLFPSFSGDLSTESESNDCFSKAVNPTPEIMAQLIEMIYKVRNDKNYHIKDSNEYKEFLKTIEDRKDSSQKSTIKTQRKTINKFVDNIEIMIREQENDSENSCSVEKPLPKYTTERMILSYFIKHFNNKDDVRDFYNELGRRIKGKSIISKDEAISRVDKFHQLYGKCNSENNNTTPYNTSNLVSSGFTNFINDIGNGNIEFEKNHGFSDCVETSIRHIINFLTYSKNGFLLSKEDNELNREHINELINAIENNENVAQKDLKELIGLFYLYQTPEKANDGSVLIRTMWNCILSNMNGVNKNENFYSLTYAKDSNEVKSGFLNMLKACWNIAFVINNGEGCDVAKDAIDNIQKSVNDGDLENLNEELIDAIEKTFVLFNPQNKIKVKELKELTVQKSIRGEFPDAFGSVQIEVNNLFVFSIQQSNGHAKIDYNYEKRLALDDEEKKTYLDNQDALLLYESLSGDIQNSSQTKLNDFNALYSKIEVNRSLIDSPYGQVSKALEFYRRNDLSGDRAFKFFKNNKLVLENCKKVKIGNLSLDLAILNKISNDSQCDQFIDSYLQNVYFGAEDEKFENPDVDKFFESDIKNKKTICEIIKNDSLTIDQIKCLAQDDLFKNFDNRSVMSVAIDSLSDDDFNLFIDSIAQEDKIKCADVCEGFTSFEYAISRKSWNKVKKIASVLDDLNRFYLHGDENGRYTAIGLLIKENKLDILEENKDKIDFNSVVYCHGNQNCTGYELMSILKNDEMQKILNPNEYVKREIRESGRAGLEQLKTLTQKDIFEMDYDYTKTNKSIMAIAIETLSDNEFDAFLKLVDNKYLKGNSVFHYVNNEAVVYDNRSFEYAVKIGEIEKAKIILKYVDKLDFYYDPCLVTSDYECFTAVGVLLKDGYVDLLEQNKEKFNFNVWAYLDSNGREYNTAEYIDEVLKLPQIKEKLGI